MSEGNEKRQAKPGKKSLLTLFTRQRFKRLETASSQKVTTLDTDQCKAFESSADNVKVTASFTRSPRFTLLIPKQSSFSSLRLIPSVDPSSKIMVLSTQSDRVDLFTLNPQKDGTIAEYYDGLERFNDQVLDVAVDLDDNSAIWTIKDENSAVSVLRKLQKSVHFQKDLFTKLNPKLLIRDSVIGCNQDGKVEVRDRQGRLKSNKLLSVYDCDHGIIGEKDGHCFGLVQKALNQNGQFILRFYDTNDLTREFEPISIFNADEPGVLSGNCKKHAQKVIRGIRFSDTRKGNVIRTIGLGTMKVNQMLFFDNAGKMVLSDISDSCQIRVINIDNGATMNLINHDNRNRFPNRCTHLVRGEHGTVVYLSQTITNVIQCDHDCRIRINAGQLRVPTPVQHISVPSPNGNFMVAFQRIDDHLSRNSRAYVIDLRRKMRMGDAMIQHFPQNGIQWRQHDEFIVRQLYDSSIWSDIYSVKNDKLDPHWVGVEAAEGPRLRRCEEIIQFPYANRFLCSGESTFILNVRQKDWQQQRVNLIPIKLDPDIKANREFSIDNKWLITYEKHKSDDGKGLIKWFHTDHCDYTLDLYRSCEYSKSQIQAMSMWSCWMDRDTNVYSDGSKIKVQRIGVGILDEMDIGYIPTALQCANGFILTSSEDGLIHAWNLTFRAQSQSAHRLPVISNPSRFRSPISRANRSTQTESVLAYPERVRTLQMRAERGSVLATAEGYRSEPARKPHYALVIGGIAAGVLLVSVLIALLIWMRVKRVSRKTKMAELRNTRVVQNEVDATLEPGMDPSAQQSIEMVRARIFAQGEGSVSLEGNHDESDGCDGQTEGVMHTGFQSEDSFTFTHGAENGGQTGTAQRKGER